MSDEIRNSNWSSHSLGDIAQWPMPLLNGIAGVLHAPIPAALLWGPDLIFFCNDPFALRVAPGSSGKPVRDVIHDAALENIAGNVFQHGASTQHNLPWQEGETATFSFSPIFVDGGTVGGVQVFCTPNEPSNTRDIRESESLLRFAVEATALGIWDYNPATNTFTSNRRLREIFGLPDREEVALDDAISNIAEVDRDRVVQAINKALDYRSGGHFDIVYKVIHPQTKVCSTVRVMGKAAFDENRKAVRFNGTLQDISTLVASAQKIEESERRFHAIIEHSPIAKCLLRGPELTVDVANAGMLKLWRTDHSIIGKPFEQVIWNIPYELRQQILTLYDTGDTLRVNEFVVKSDDEARYYSLSFKPITDSDGTIFGIIHTAIDISEQVRTRQIIERSELRFKNLISQAPVAIGYFVGPDHIIEMANRHMIDIIGKGEDIIGKALVDVMPELQGDMKPFLTRMDIVFQNGTPFTVYEQRANIIRNGQLSENYYDITYSPVFDENHRVQGILEIAIEVSEKVLAQQQILDSESRFRNLVESAPIPIGVYTGRDMRIMLANKTILDIFGKGPDIIGKTYAEVNPELESQQVFKQLQHVYETGQSFHAANSRIDILDQGVPRSYYFNYNFTPLRDRLGNVYGVLNTAADVTDLNRIRLDLEESEKNLRNIILQAPVAMCILRGANLVVDIANERMYDLWGRPANAMAGKPLFDILKELKGQGFDEQLTGVFTTGETYQANGVPVSLDHDGEMRQFYVDFVYQAIREANNEITGVLVVAIDVTANVMARKKIEAAENRARLAIKSANLGTYEVDLVNSDLRVSKRFQEIFGVDKSHLLRSEITHMIHPDDSELRLAAHQEALKTGVLRYEARVIRPDSKIIYIRANGFVLFDDKGQPKTLLGVVQDITEEKLFAEELSKQVKDRTQELYRSNEDLMRFAHVASHDLKEPVRKIKVFSNMIEEQFGSQIPPKAHVYLGKVQSAADRMFSMIEGVLAYSALNASDQPIDRIDLNEVFGSIATDLEVLIERKKASLIPDELPEIDGAQVLIYQLFYNLINNALKFSKEDLPNTLRVKAQRFDKNRKGFVKIEISDTGIGLDPAYADKIFDAFARLNAKDKYEGTGLGLALCKKIVERHHGSISATGQPGEGATFTIVLPEKQSGKLL